MRHIITQSEAHEVFMPHLNILTNSINTGFTDFQNLLLQQANNGLLINFPSRTKASLINDFVTSRLKESFQEVEGVKSLDQSKIFALNFHSKVIVRIKKLKNDLSPSNIPTKQTKAYNNQYSIIGFPDEPTFLYIGYTTNSTSSILNGIYIVCRKYNQTEWFIDITNHNSQEQTNLNFANIVDTENAQTRVKIKTEVAAALKTGTE